MTPTDPADARIPAAEDTVPWARQAARPQPRSTERTRRMVDSLPSWEPLPPGEILVRRNHHRED